MTPSQRISVARIARVNHAGEFGAIRIYGAQIFVAGRLWPDVAETLRDLRAHEIEHCRKFFASMPSRGSRPCRTMWLWSMGGWLLGFVTAILGRHMIWVCTEVVEHNVHRHLSAQMHFLRDLDAELHDLIASIQAEEEGHLTLARENRGKGGALTHAASVAISGILHLVIWLSTWGDSSRMARDLRAVA